MTTSMLGMYMMMMMTTMIVIIVVIMIQWCFKLGPGCKEYNSREKERKRQPEKNIFVGSKATNSIATSLSVGAMLVHVFINCTEQPKNSVHLSIVHVPIQHCKANYRHSTEQILKDVISTV
jgi:hypothetical protein